MTSPREATDYLRDAREILGPHASAPEVILAADFIARGYISDKAIAVLQPIGVERARHPQPDDTDEATSEVVTGTPASPEFGFAPAPDPLAGHYWEDRR